MKVIILLAIVCSVFANEGEHDPCLHACKEQVKTKLEGIPELADMSPEKMMTPEGRTKMRECIKNYLEGKGIPEKIGNVEAWTKKCTIGTEAETCVNACPDSPKKEGVKKFLGLFKLGCDEDFKSSVKCLVDVSKEASETCQTKCTPHAQKLKEFLTQRDANPTERVLASKEVLESGCKFINCRLNCRKTDIVNKCQDKGFEQAKKFWSANAVAMKMLYKRAGGDLNNWPENCKSEKIIEANNY